MVTSPRAAWIGASLSLVTLYAAAVGATRATANESQPKYDKMGDEAPGGRCYDSWEIVSPVWERCKGYPKQRFKDLKKAEDHRKFITFLRSAGWNDSVIRTPRLPADANLPQSEWPIHSIQAISDGHKFRFKKIPKQGIVLAKITVSPGAKPDRFYGLSDTADFERTYYLVSEAYEPADGETSGPPFGDRWRISTWFLLGIKGTGNSARVVQMPNRTGRLSWCGHGHDDEIRAAGASFLTCDGQNTVQLIRKNRPAMELLRSFAGPSSPPNTGPASDTTRWIIEVGKRLLSRSLAPGALTVTVSPAIRELLLPLQLVDPFSDPVWMTCGVGCCIAET